MNKLVLFCAVAATVIGAFAGDGYKFKFASSGDTYADGTAVQDGEVYALVWTANGTFAWDTDTEVAGMSVATGGTLSFAGGVLAVDDDVSLAGVTLQDAGNALAGGSGWHRILVAKSVSGEPVMPPSWEARLVSLADGLVALELHDVRGTTIIFR